MTSKEKQAAELKQVYRNQVKLRAWNLVIDVLIDTMEEFNETLTPTEVAEDFTSAVMHKAFRIAKIKEQEDKDE